VAVNIQVVRRPVYGLGNTPERKSLYAIFISSGVFYTAFLYDPAYISASQISTSFRFVSGENAMDILYIALMIGFIALSIGLTYFFETLRRPK
jgi:hypothetical protein